MNAEQAPLDNGEEQRVAQLIDRAQQSDAVRSRIYKLVESSNSLVANLDLSAVLHGIATAAADLMNAKYAAIGVIGPRGNLEHFTHTGMSDAEVAAIGDLPEGKGLLGALLHTDQPLRLAKMSADPRSVGFPPHHPPMTSFLGVPILMRGEVLGRLYLSDRLDGEEFSEIDEVFATTLAASAGIAISNARLLEEVQYKEQWSAALAETMRIILTDGFEEGMTSILHATRTLAQADLVVIAMNDEGDELVIDMAEGELAEELLSQSFSVLEGNIGQVAVSGITSVLTDLENEPLAQFGISGTAVIAPIFRADSIIGLLITVRNAKAPDYAASDVAMVNSFADQAGIAIDKMRSAEAVSRVELLEDRNRIARDLHDHVIQRIFAAGLSLKAVATRLGDSPESAKLTEQIAELDHTISDIRHTIFALQRGTRGTDGVRSRVLEILERVSDSFDIEPRVQFSGPVDLITDAALADDIVAVINEGLTNVVKHAHASTARVFVSAMAGELTIEIKDDGAGLGEGHGHGLNNMHHRAEARGGEFSIGPAKPRGTTLFWSVPV